MSAVGKRIEQVRELVFLVISPHRGSYETVAQKLSLCFDWFIAILILYSSALAFASTFKIPETWHGVMSSLERVDDVVLWIFSFEYLLRVWTADLCFKADRRARSFDRLRRTWKFIWSPLAIIDLLAILSFWLPVWIPVSFVKNPRLFTALRFFRIMRLLRYAKRYGTVLDNMWAVLKDQKKELKVSLIAIGTLMLVASVLMYAAEHERQPVEFANAFSGLWWAVTTITTLGYGDLKPITTFGRFCGAVIVLAGVAALAVPTAIINSGFVKRSMTAEELQKMLSRHDAEQDKQLEEQRRMIDALTKRFSEFECLQQEKDRRQDEKLEQQRQRIDKFADEARGMLVNLEKALLAAKNGYGETMKSCSEEVRRLAEAVTNRFVDFGNLLHEKDKAWDEKFEQQRRGIDQLATATRDHLDGMGRALSDARNRDLAEVARLHQEGLARYSEIVDGSFAHMKQKLDEQQQLFQHYFALMEKPEGALKKSMKRVASWLTPRKG